MIASSFQDKYMSSRILGEATGHGQARSTASYDDEIVGCFQFCDRRRHSCCRRVEAIRDQSTEGSSILRVVYDDDEDEDDDVAVIEDTLDLRNIFYPG